jgi:putative ATP-dependent endonuclease of OLD family
MIEMQIANLRIENFRGVRTGHVHFGSQTVFVGPNNCGKTTVIEALALLFGRDRLIRNLTEHDFYGADPQPADRIRLVATVTGFEGDDPAEHVDWFRDDRGVPKWLDPATGLVHARRENPAWHLACQIAFAARFDRPSLEVETARYFHDDDSVRDIFDDETWTSIPQRLIRDIGFFLVPASRTWDRIISFGSELFRRVVASGSGPPAEAVLVERDRLRQPERPLEADANLARW